MNQSVRRIDVPSVPLPPQPPPECDHELIWCQCLNPACIRYHRDGPAPWPDIPPTPRQERLAALDLERAARADACLEYADQVLGIPLTDWQRALVRALYMGEHVRVGRAWGLHTVERVIEQHEASRGDAT